MNPQMKAVAPTKETTANSKRSKQLHTRNFSNYRKPQPANTAKKHTRSAANSLKPSPATSIQESATKLVKEHLQPARAVSCRITPRQLAKQAIRAARDCDPENRAKVLRSVACWWSVHTPPPEAWDYLVGVFVALTGISHAAALEIIDSTRAALGGDAA